MAEITASTNTPGQAGESNTMLYVFGIGIIILLAIGGWYMLAPRQTNMPKVTPGTNPDDPINQKIPGVSPSTTAVGILTDKNFFEGLSNLGMTIYDLVQRGKAEKTGGTGNQSGGYTGGNLNPDSKQGKWIDRNGEMVWVPNNSNMTDEERNRALGLA